MFSHRNAVDLLTMLVGLPEPAYDLTGTQAATAGDTKVLWAFQSLGSDMVVTIVLRNGITLTSKTLTQDVVYNLGAASITLVSGVGDVLVWEG